MLVRKPKDLDCILEAARDGFVDEEGRPAFNDRAGLFEVGATIDTLKQYGVDFFTERFDGWDYFDAEVILELFCEAINPCVARFHIGASPFERGDDFASGNVIGMTLIVEELGECNDMGSVEADQSDLNGIGCRGVED